jgi:autotransporter-associated beta strand protein
MNRISHAALIGVSTAFLLGGHALWAADVVKTNNTDNLNLGSSWVGSTAPGSSDVAVWDNTSASGSFLLGADLEFQGMRIGNPGGVVTISAGNTLTLGASGIDIVSRSLNIVPAMLLSAAQEWTIGTGLFLDNNNNANTEGVGVDNQGHDLTINVVGVAQNVSNYANLRNLAGSGDMIKDGSGRVRFTGFNSSFTGNIILNDGVLHAGFRASALGSGSSTLTLNGGQLTFGGNTAVNFGRNTTVAGDAELFNNNSTGNGGLSYTFGTLSMGAHTLTVNRNDSGGTATPGNITFGATTLTGDATFNVGNHGTDPAGLNQLTLGAVGESGGSRSITKTGEGTLILNGSNTFAGATDIQDGTVQLGANGTLSGSSSITIHSNAVLEVSEVAGGLILNAGQEVGGSGTVRGDLTVGNGATLSPGNSLGVLSVSNLTLAAGSIIDWEFENDTDAGTTYDQIAGAGLLTLNGTVGDKIVINIIGLTGHTVGLGDSFTLYTGDVTGFDADAVELVNQSDWTGGWAISDGGSLVLEAIPEPSVVWLLIAGFSALIHRYRRMNI